MIDISKITMIAHILIRDPDTDETILRRRDSDMQSKKPEEDTDPKASDQPGTGGHTDVQYHV